MTSGDMHREIIVEWLETRAPHVDAQAVLRAFAWRGKNAGFLKQRAPCRRNDPEAHGAWLAIVQIANPFKMSISGLLFMPDEARAVYRELQTAIEAEAGKAMDWRAFDRDASRLRSIGVM